MPTLRVKVIPNAPKTEIVGTMDDGSIKIRLKAPAVDNKANEALIDFLAEHFSVKRRQVRLVSGEKSRNKVILISDE